MNITDVLVDAIRHLAPLVYRMGISAGYRPEDTRVTLFDRPNFYSYEVYICPEYGRVILFDHTSRETDVVVRAELSDPASMGRLLDAIQRL